MDSFFGHIDDEQLKHYIQYPMRFNKQIRNICKRMYNLNGILAEPWTKWCRPTLDHIIIPNGTKRKAKKLAKYMEFFFKKINHKLSTRDIYMLH